MKEQSTVPLFDEGVPLFDEGAEYCTFDEGTEYCTFDEGARRAPPYAAVINTHLHSPRVPYIVQ